MIGEFYGRAITRGVNVCGQAKNLKQHAPDYSQIVMRGMATMVPAMKRYLQRMPKPYVDGGYYTKPKENRLLVGALPVDGAFVIGALSGFGLMASMAIKRV